MREAKAVEAKPAKRKKSRGPMAEPIHDTDVVIGTGSTPKQGSMPPRSDGSLPPAKRRGPPPGKGGRTWEE